ncbi:MAG: hypothetical protein ACI4JZ_08380, partial [Oscillospiraceae bacterium]
SSANSPKKFAALVQIALVSRFQRNRKPALFGEIASSANSPAKFAVLVQITRVPVFNVAEIPRRLAGTAIRCNSFTGRLSGNLRYRANFSDFHRKKLRQMT